MLSTHYMMTASGKRNSKKNYGKSKLKKGVAASDGLPEHMYLVIPCRAANKPDRIVPLLLVETNEFGGPERGVYQCEQCTRIYHTRKAWAKHAGMVPNIMGSCTGG